MKIEKRVLTKIWLIAVAGMLAAGSGWAQDEDAAERESARQKTKQAQAVSKQVYDRIQKAQEEIDAENFPGALRILGSLLTDKLTEYERTNVLNYIGFVKYSTDDITGAMAAYDEMLKIPSLEEQIRKGTLYTMAQLSTMQEDWNKALRYLDDWFALETNPAPEPFILKAQNLYQINRYSDMVEPIESAIAVAKKREKPVKEDWYTLLNFAYYQQEDYAMVRDIQKILLINWPKKSYWISLAGAYTELGEEENLLTSYDAAHTQGMLEKDAELVTMAQLYMQYEVPYKAGVLLEREMASGRVNKNAKNYRLLSQAWTLAQEDEKAIPALQAAARLSDEGEVDLRLGNRYLNLGQYEECVAAIKAGNRKGGIRSPDNAQISLGMCLYNLKKYREAIAAFRAAGKTTRSRRMANQWIKVIQSDIERDKQIRLAETAARKKQEELAKKRRAAERI